MYATPSGDIYKIEVANFACRISALFQTGRARWFELWGRVTLEALTSMDSWHNWTHIEHVVFLMGSWWCEAQALDPRSVSFRSQHTNFQKPVFNWLSSGILRSSLWLLNVVDVNLVFILGHFLLLHILIDVVGSRLIRNLLELGDLSAVVILNLELTCQLIF